MVRTIGVCTASRSERPLTTPIVEEINSGKYNLKAELIETNSMFFTPLRNTSFDILREYSFLIIPADRTEMCKFALDCFHNNIAFCHLFAGINTFSHTHDDINRWIMSFMANFCFAESPECRDNLLRAGIPEDRILITGDTHMDGITIQDIEANKPKDSPEGDYDLILYNPTTTTSETICVENLVKSPNFIDLRPNEDSKTREKKEYQRLEFLWLLHHAKHFISNSSSGLYELPYLQKYYGSKCKLVNPSQRNKERTPISPEYCRGASKIIAEWAEKVDLDWLRTPKRLFQTKSFPSGY